SLLGFWLRPRLIVNCELETMAIFPEAESDSGSAVVAKTGRGALQKAIMEHSTKNDATDTIVRKRMTEKASTLLDFDRVEKERHESCQMLQHQVARNPKEIK